MEKIWNDYVLPEKQKTDELLKGLTKAKLLMENQQIGGFTRGFAGDRWEAGSTYETVFNLITKYEAINKQ